jgi:hypothetical protein
MQIILSECQKCASLYTLKKKIIARSQNSVTLEISTDA